MSIPAAVANVANLLVGIGKYFSRGEHHERVEDSLISTGDNLAEWSRTLHDYLVTNNINVDKKTLQYLDHFIRKWQADRKKLK